MQRNKAIHFVVFGALLIFGSVLPFCANAADKQDELREIEREIKSGERRKADLTEKSRNLQKETAALRAELIALSQSVQKREATVTQLENALAQLRVEEEQARRVLEARHGQTVETLMALQRMALNPPEAIIALPQPPSDMVRSAILLRSVVPHIQQRATALRKEVRAYAEKRKKMERQKERLGLASQDLAQERQRLTKLIADKKALSEKYIADSRKTAKQVAQLSEKARSLRSLIDKLEQEKARQAKIKAQQPPRKPQRPSQGQESADDVEEGDDNDLEIVLGKPPEGKPITKAKGELARPAVGSIVMRFGQQEKLGGKHKGISIKTRNSARVVATYDGQIAFAGPFRGYKQLLIIDHGAGYHTLLTGMDRIDVSVGQWLLSGEPVGVMAEDASIRKNLYFELRKNGAPINPLPWIRQRNAKAQG